MKAPVRVVCGACLQSLEYSSAEVSTALNSCPYCGTEVDLARANSDAPTSDEFYSPPPDEPADLTTPKVDVPPPPPGQIGRFLIREPLGEGGYGTVYRAYDPHLDREVALKVFKSNRLNEKALERFFREARAAARLDHPNIVGLHDAGRDDGRCWIAYQLVTGRTLSQIRDHDRPSILTSVRIVRDLALAVDHAHGRGVFHRDLKPANVLVDVQGRSRLTDFGLARREDVDSDLTREGTVLGTPAYMSPEAAAGRAHEADARSDVYSLGVILYELICGRKPADVPTGAPLWRSTRMPTPPTPRSVDRAIPPALDRVCMKALAFDRADRYKTAKLLADELTRHLDNAPPGPRPRLVSNRHGALLAGLAVAASVLCLVLGMSPNLASRRPSTANGASIVDSIQPPKLFEIPAADVVAGVPGAPEILAPKPPAHERPTSGYVASTESKKGLFHAWNCSTAASIKHLEEFASVDEALKAGLTPCKSCKTRKRIIDPNDLKGP